MIARPRPRDRLTDEPSVAGSARSGHDAPTRWRAAPSSTGTGRSAGNSSGLCRMALTRVSATFPRKALFLPRLAGCVAGIPGGLALDSLDFLACRLLDQLALRPCGRFA